MQTLRHRTRTLLGAATAAAVLVLPSAALADCAKTVDKAAFKGSIAEYYPQQCYSNGLKQLGPDVNTYSPNVSRNLKSAMRRDRTRKLKFSVVWLPGNRVLVTSNYKLKSSIQVRKGSKVLAKGAISGKGAKLKLKQASGRLTVAVIWTLGTGKVTVAKSTQPGAVVKKLKLTIQWLPKHKVRIRSNYLLSSVIQLRKGKKILSRGAISGRTTTLSLKQTANPLTVAVIWNVGNGQMTVTRAASPV